MSTYRQLLGRKGEEIAERFLIQKNYEIIQRNYRRYRGEIDLIAKDGGCLVFVEVKSVSSDRFGQPVSKVNQQKQKQLGKIAMAYYQEFDLFDQDSRFDIVTVIFKGSKHIVNHIENAFWLENSS